MLRGLRLMRIRGRALAQLRFKEFSFEQAIGTPMKIVAAAKEAETPRRRGRPGLPDDHYKRIALEYLELFAAGYRRGILDELACRHKRPKQTVRDWVHRARELDYLTKGKQGRAGAKRGHRL